MPYKPESGQVFLYRAKDDSSKNNWRSNGHRFIQTNGGRWCYNGMLRRRISHLVTPESGRQGTNKFMMISWIHKEKPDLTLLQFVGDHTLSVDFPHGNSKKSNMPYHRSAPQLIRELEVCSSKPAKVYNEKVAEASSDIAGQRLRVPRNLAQVRNARQNYKKITVGVDSFTNLHNLALSYPDITFLATVPDLILVMISPEMKDQAKEIFKVDYDKSRQKQLLGYDTQFELGDFYCSSVTIRDVRFRTTRNGNAPIIPIAYVIHERKLALHHEIAWKVIVDEIEEIGTKKMVSVSDDEFTNLLESFVKKGFVAKCENHGTQKIGRWVKEHGGNKDDQSVYKNDFR